MNKKLNDLALSYIERYQNLNIYNKKVNCTYFINQFGMSLVSELKNIGISKETIIKVNNLLKQKQVLYAWDRGKGTPKQIEQNAVKLSKKVNINLQNANKEGITNFLNLYGLGVDCSGFVFNTLNYTFKKVNKQKAFLNSLSFAGDDKSASKAGVFVFNGEASRPIKPTKIKPLDILINKNNTHISLVVKKSGDLYLAQSNLDSNGVNLSKINVTSNKVDINFKTTISKPYNILLKNGVIEFRRLKILS